MYKDSFYDDNDDGGFEDDVVPELVPCGNCGRNFNPDSLGRHQKVCAKGKKRKPFDSKKQRIEGLEKPKVTASSPAQSIKKAPKKKDWRRQHEEFIKTIRSARGVTNALKTGAELPPPPEPTINPDYIQCTYCNRRFSESAAERHINFCKEQKSRLPKANSDSKFDQKKAKQAIRTQYRPPVPGQKKKSSTDSQSPAKPRGSGNNLNNTRSPASRPDSSPGMVRKTSSKTMLSKRNDERPLPTTNARYNKHNYSSPEPENTRTRSGKTKNAGDPGWFSDLKNHGSAGKGGSGGKSRGQPLDDIDSGLGLDLNENFENQNSAKRGRSHPVGVVRPSSRSKDDELFSDMSDKRAVISAGRRQKLANFCHDCGTRYPVQEAKFCCECGVRRMCIT